MRNTSKLLAILAICFYGCHPLPEPIPPIPDADAETADSLPSPIAGDHCQVACTVFTRLGCPHNSPKASCTVWCENALDGGVDLYPTAPTTCAGQ